MSRLLLHCAALRLEVALSIFWRGRNIGMKGWEDPAHDKYLICSGVGRRRGKKKATWLEIRTCLGLKYESDFALFTQKAVRRICSKILCSTQMLKEQRLKQGIRCWLKRRFTWQKVHSKWKVRKSWIRFLQILLPWKCAVLNIDNFKGKKNSAVTLRNKIWKIAKMFKNSNILIHALPSRREYLCSKRMLKCCSLPWVMNITKPPAKNKKKYLQQ